MLYPGSIERTSIGEAEEEKGFMIIELTCDGNVANADWRFHKLPARPLVRHDLQLDGLDPERVELAIRLFVDSLPADAVVSLRITGEITEPVSRILSATSLRALAPPTMNLDLRMVETSDGPRLPRRSRANNDELELPL